MGRAMRDAPKADGESGGSDQGAGKKPPSDDFLATG